MKGRDEGKREVGREKKAEMKQKEKIRSRGRGNDKEEIRKK